MASSSGDMDVTRMIDEPRLPKDTYKFEEQLKYVQVVVHTPQLTREQITARREIRRLRRRLRRSYL